MGSLTHELATLGLQTLGLLTAVWVVSRLTSSIGGRLPLRFVGAGVIGAFAFALAIFTLDQGASTLDAARLGAVDARGGLETCVHEANQQQLLPYLNWLKARLPKHAVYALAPYSGQPDLWCMTLVLLPSLPAGLGGHPEWLITLGTLPGNLRNRIAQHDPSVTVYAPGFALARVA